MKKKGREKYILLVLIGVIGMAGIILIIWKNVNNSVILSGMVSNSKLNVRKKEESVEFEDKIKSVKLDNSKKLKDSVHLNEEKKGSDNVIMVHITGEVKNSGVYKLPVDARVIHAIKAAGGKTSLGDIDSLNLAAPIYDGDKIYIPSIVETMTKSDKTVSGANSGYRMDNDIFYSGNLSNNSEKININRATSKDLQKLSGIGPSKAGSIIDYRKEIGRFQSVDELLDVSGIGDKTLEKIKDKISIR